MFERPVRIAAILVNYQKAARLVESVQSLAVQSAADRIDIIVVDNSHDARQATILREKLANVSCQLIIAPTNLGYTRGVNLGATKVMQGSHVLLVNPDIVVDDPDTIKKLIEVLDGQADIGVLAAMQRDDDGSVVEIARRFPSLPRLLLRRLLPGQLTDYDLLHPLQQTPPAETIDVEWVQSSFTLIRNHVWQRIGGLDEFFHMFMADTVLGEDARRLGYRVTVTSASTVRADGLRASRGGLKAMFTSRVLRVHLIDASKYELVRLVAVIRRPPFDAGGHWLDAATGAIRASLRSPTQLLGFAFRAASLGSRFLFVLVAVMFMTPLDFGIYGLVSAAVALIVQAAGLELYQITLRAIAKSEEGQDSNKAHYGRFIVLASGAAAIVGSLYATWFGWAPEVVTLAAGVCAAEYLGTETQRICLVEGRADLAMFSVSLRFLPWNLGLPVAGLLGVIPESCWSIEFVLASWLLSSVIGSAFLIIIGRPYMVRAASSFRGWFWVLAPQIPRWIVIALCYRFLETGIRMVPGIMIDEQTAGRFVLLSTLAYIGSTGVKAALEPFWFVRLIRPDSGGAARREFATVTVVCLCISAILSGGMLAGMDAAGRIKLDSNDWASFGLLVISASFLSLSQIPHFGLYAAEQDKAIQVISIVTLLISLATTSIGTALMGLTGTALGAALGAASFFLGKAILHERIQHTLSAKT